MTGSEEVWKPIGILCGFYEVSSYGRIRSIGRMIVSRNGVIRKLERHILKPRIGRNGYYGLTLQRNGEKFYPDVHRLVAETFLDNYNDSFVVNHKNGNKRDNRVCNLEWVSPRRNTEHAIENGLRKDIGQGSKLSKLTETQVIEMRKLYFSDNMKVVDIALKFGISKGYVPLIMSRRRWAHI